MGLARFLHEPWGLAVVVVVVNVVSESVGEDEDVEHEHVGVLVVGACPCATFVVVVARESYVVGDGAGAGAGAGDDAVAFQGTGTVDPYTVVGEDAEFDASADAFDCTDPVARGSSHLACVEPSRYSLLAQAQGLPGSVAPTSLVVSRLVHSEVQRLLGVAEMTLQYLEEIRSPKSSHSREGRETCSSPPRFRVAVEISLPPHGVLRNYQDRTARPLHSGGTYRPLCCCYP